MALVKVPETTEQLDQVRTLMRAFVEWYRHFLVELMTSEQAASYTAHFGTQDMPDLDGKLRELERELAVALGMASLSLTHPT